MGRMPADEGGLDSPPVAPKIEVRRVSVDLERSVDVFEAHLEDAKGVWDEGFGSEAELRAFLTGVRAGCGMLGVHIVDPEIPRNPSARFVEEIPEPDDLPL